MNRSGATVRIEHLLALVLVPLCAWLVYLSLDFPAGSRILPLGSLAVLVLGSLALCFTRTDRIAVSAFSSNASLRFYLTALLLVTYAASFYFVNFFLSTTVFMLVGSILLGVRNWAWIAGSILCLNALVWAIFVAYLQVPLP